MNIAFIIKKVRDNQYDLSAHAHQERQVEQITIDEIEKTLLEGDIIEQYPNDPRGKSCLVSGKVMDQTLHLVCGIRGDKLPIVTLYRPKPPIWKDYKTRAKELESRV